MPGRSGVVAPACTSQAGDSTDETTLPTGGPSCIAAALAGWGAAAGAGAAWAETVSAKAMAAASARVCCLDMTISLEIPVRIRCLAIIRRGDINGCSALVVGFQGD